MKKLLAVVALSAASCAASAGVIVFNAALGPEVARATGSGFMQAFYDTVSHDLRIVADWSGLSGTTTVAHIHCCVAVAGAGTVGVAVTPGTLPGFPAGVQSGHYETPSDIDLDLASSFTAAFISTFGGGTVDGARNALLAGMSAGTAYFNIHTTAFPGGEIRGFLQVPEPGTLGLAGLALGLVAVGLRRRAA